MRHPEPTNELIITVGPSNLASAPFYWEISINGDPIQFGFTSSSLDAFIEAARSAEAEIRGYLYFRTRDGQRMLAGSDD